MLDAEHEVKLFDAIPKTVQTSPPHHDNIHRGFSTGSSKPSETPHQYLPEPPLLHLPSSAPYERVQHAGQSSQCQAHIGHQGHEESVLGVVRPEIQGGLSDPAEEGKSGGNKVSRFHTLLWASLRVENI